MFRELVVLLAALALAQAGLAGARLQPKPDKFKHIEGCYFEDLDKVIPFGESVPSKNNCLEYRCSSPYYQIVTCGSAMTKPPCRLKEDHSKPYPECCPKIVCP